MQLVELHGICCSPLFRQLYLQSSVLGLQLPQSLRLVNLHATEFKLPTLEALRRDAILAHQVRHPRPSLMRLEEVDALLYHAALAFYIETSLRSSLREISQ